MLGTGMLLTELEMGDSPDAAVLTARAEAERAAGHCLGATEGDTVFRCVPTLRAVRSPAQPEDWLCDGWEVSLSGTLREVQPARLALLRAADDAGSAVCLNRLIWVGRWGRGLLVITLHDAVNLAGLTLTLREGDTARLPFRFLANGEAGSLRPPCDIRLVEEET